MIKISFKTSKTVERVNNKRERERDLRRIERGELKMFYIDYEFFILKNKRMVLRE